MSFSIRFEYTKQGDPRFLSHLDVMGTMERALRRSGLPIEFTKGFHPRPKVCSDPALPVGYESDGEGLTVHFQRQVAPAEAMLLLNDNLPAGLQFVRAGIVQVGAKQDGANQDRTLGRVATDRMRYELRLPGPGPSPQQIERFMAQDTLCIEVPRKGLLDVRTFLESIEVASFETTSVSTDLEIGSASHPPGPSGRSASGTVATIVKLTLVSIAGRSVRPEQLLAVVMGLDDVDQLARQIPPVRDRKLSPTTISDISGSGSSAGSGVGSMRRNGLDGRAASAPRSQATNTSSSRDAEAPSPPEPMSSGSLS
jgi:radical SAM-linked protein